MRNGVMGGEILVQHLPGSIRNTRVPIAALSHLVEQSYRATPILCFRPTKGSHPVLNTARSHGDRFARLPCQNLTEPPIRRFLCFWTGVRHDLAHSLLKRRGGSIG